MEIADHTVSVRKSAGADGNSGSQTLPADKTKKKSQRKKLYDLHSWVGFHLALIMGVVLFTGTIATISNELDWIFQPDMRVTPGEQTVSWGTMENAIEAYVPDRNIQSISSLGADYLPYRARVTDEMGNMMFIHVNQWTGEVTGETHPLTIQRFFRDLHRYLFMPGVIALPIICSLAFALLISLYTGLKTSRNWKTLMTRVRFNKGARIMWGDAHKAAGLWSIWFFVVIAITALWYLLEWGYGVGGTRMVPDRPTIAAERVVEYGKFIEDRSLGEIEQATKAAYPELRIAQVQYPTASDRPFTVLGYNSNPLLRERANMVFVDPQDASIVDIISEDDLDFDTYLNEMADPLHFGNFGGLATKLIWFVFGVFMTGLSFTGVWLTWKRLKTTKVTRPQWATTPILVAGLVAGYFYIDRYLTVAAPPEGEVLFARQNWAEGGYAQLGVSELSPDNQKVHRMVINSEHRPNLEAVKLCRGAECVEKPNRQALKHMTLEFELADTLSSSAHTYDVTLRFGDGSERVLSWDATPSEIARAKDAG